MANNEQLLMQRGYKYICITIKMLITIDISYKLIKYCIYQIEYISFKFNYPNLSPTQCNGIKISHLHLINY